MGDEISQQKCLPPPLPCHSGAQSDLQCFHPIYTNPNNLWKYLASPATLALAPALCLLSDSHSSIGTGKAPSSYWFQSMYIIPIHPPRGLFRILQWENWRVMDISCPTSPNSPSITQYFRATHYCESCWCQSMPSPAIAH